MLCYLLRSHFRDEQLTLPVVGDATGSKPSAKNPIQELP